MNSQDFEKEADYVGLYIMANARQEIEEAAKELSRKSQAGLPLRPEMK